MRRILVNRARDKNRQKRGGSLRRVDLDAIELALDTPAEDLLALDEALPAAGRGRQTLQPIWSNCGSSPA